MKLPVIPTSCDGCGACCMEQNSPPILIAFLGSMCDEFRRDFPDDAEIFDGLPPEAKASLERYYQDLISGSVIDGMPCIWLDMKTKRCKHYEHRPTICRNGLLLGDEGCLDWRDKYITNHSAF